MGFCTLIRAQLYLIGIFIKLVHQNEVSKHAVIFRGHGVFFIDVGEESVKIEMNLYEVEVIILREG